MIRYLIISTAYMAVFYIVYQLLISKDTRYRRNRLYLLVSIVLSLLLPMVSINPPTGSIISSLNENLGAIVSLGQVDVYPGSGTESNAGSVPLLTLIYLAGCLAALTVLLINIINLSLLILKYRVKGTRIVLTPPGKESGFSAAGFIFLSNDLEDELKDTISEHEQRHISNRHFIDTILLRIVAVFFWFNPFIYLYDRSLKAIHEFEADEQMLDSGNNIISYQRLILNQIFNTSIFTLQNGFSGRSLIKKRMIMMTKRRSKRTSGLKLLLGLPLILLVFSVFSCSDDEITPLEEVNEAGDVQFEPFYMFDIEENSKTSAPVEIPETKSQKKEIFVVVEDMPTFRGGDVNKFREWVQRTVEYPAEAVKEGIEGKVFVMFVVGTDGYVSESEIMKGVHPSLDNEVLRVVNSSPVWSAGRQRGVAVPVRFAITVNFRLQ